MPAMRGRVGGTLAAAPTRRRPCWIDRLHVQVDRIPGPTWLPYAVAWIVLALVETVLKWSTGAYPIGTFHPFHLVAMGTAVYGLGFMHVLDRSAGQALDALRPCLDLSGEEVADTRHRLTTMPEVGAFLAMLVGAGYGLLQLSPLVAPDQAAFRYASSGPFLGFEMFFMVFFLWGVVATFLYHAVRQLHIIDLLYRRHADVDLFEPRPLTTFSTYSAIMSIGIVLKEYLWIAAYPASAGATAVLLQVLLVVFLFVVSGITFFRPIWSGHRRLLEVKRERLQACHGAPDRAAEDLRAAVGDGDYYEIAGVTAAIADVTAELQRLEQASTWPWQAQSLSRFLTAVLLPLFVWGVQQTVSVFL